MWPATEENIRDSVIKVVEDRQPNIWLEVFEAYDKDTVLATVDHMADFYRTAVVIIHAKYGKPDGNCDEVFQIAAANLRKNLSEAMQRRDMPYCVRSHIRLKYSRDSGLSPKFARVAMYCQTELRSDQKASPDDNYRFKEKVILTGFFST